MRWRGNEVLPMLHVMHGRTTTDLCWKTWPKLSKECTKEHLEFLGHSNSTTTQPSLAREHKAKILLLTETAPNLAQWQPGQ